MMMLKLVQWIASKLPPPRVISDNHTGSSPYLSRYYIIGAHKAPDGSHPFNRVVWGHKYGVYLHRFHRGDEDVELHNHPWRWAISFVLVGGYIEERRVHGTCTVIRRVVRPGHFNFIRSYDFHRLDLLDGEAWTLFFVGPKVTPHFSSWGFWNRITDEFIPWMLFINRKRDPIAFERNTP